MRLVIEIIRSIHRVVHGLCTANPQVSTANPQALWITWVVILEIHPVQPLTSWRAWAAGASDTPAVCFFCAKIKTQSALAFVLSEGTFLAEMSEATDRHVGSKFYYPITDLRSANVHR